MLRIDGSYGEGGGQILRSSLALSILLQQPICIGRIRAGRRRPGLAHQHLTCVRAAATICRADVTGERLGSQRVTFSPGPVRPGHYEFDVQTAGSTSLVFQTVFLPLVMAPDPSSLTLRGGTHVSWSPCTHFLSEVFLPMMQQMQIHAKIRLQRWGWYPKGGGVVQVQISPCDTIRAFGKLESVTEVRVTGISAVSNLALSIAERQRRAVLKALPEHRATIETLDAPATGQGTVTFLCAELGRCRAGFTSLGERGKPAEHVGADAARLLSEFLGSGASVDKHLADQLVLPMAFAEGEASFTTPTMTTHLSTNLWLVEQFLPGIFEWQQEGILTIQRRG